MLTTMVVAVAMAGQASYRSRFPLPTATVPEGLGVNIHFVEPREADLAQIRSSGFRWVRFDLKWASVETSKGRYDFGKYDRLFASLGKHGLRPVVILAYGNALYGKGAPTSGAYLDAFARFASAAVSRYRERGAIWEIWNEPDLGEFWGREPDARAYSGMARRVVGEMRRVSPQEWIVGPSTATVNQAFFQRMGSMAGVFDAYSFHGYRKSAPESIVADVNRLRRTLPSGSRLICTEWGYGVGKHVSSEAAQAAYLERAYLSNLSAGVPLTIFYAWTDGPDDPNPQNRRFGLKRGDSSVKPALTSLKSLATRLNGYRYVRREGNNLIFVRGSSRIAVSMPK